MLQAGWHRLIAWTEGVEAEAEAELTVIRRLEKLGVLEQREKCH